jgi:hypothetical protein
MAVSLPNAGETSLIIAPAIKYQTKIIVGPSQPTSSANFLENKIISKTGFVKLRYKPDNA